MKHSPPHNYSEIDWTLLRAKALQEKGWKSKTASEWDKKAQSFAGRNKGAEYSQLFISHLPLKPEYSVLDIGSGPGTLSLPIAQRVSSVTALDFSKGMLNTLNMIAKEEKITNIKTCECAWEDNWEEKGIQPHDIAIASRSTGVKDLQVALRKINKFGRKYVFLSDRIGSTPLDSGAFAAIGRPFLPGPDYIFTVNILYTLGIHPNITVLRLAGENIYINMDEAIDAYRWMFKDLTRKELTLLEQYLIKQTVAQDKGQITIRRSSPPEWALIWWKQEF